VNLIELDEQWDFVAKKQRHVKDGDPESYGDAWVFIALASTQKAAVRVVMPTSGGAGRTQRARWEGGRLRMAAQHLPDLAAAVLHGSWGQAEPMLELALLPLAFHSAALALTLCSRTALCNCLRCLACSWWRSMSPSPS